MKNDQKIEKLDVDKIFNDNQAKLKNFIRTKVSNTADAEDVLQDVFLQLVRTVEDAINPIEQVSAWLYRVTKNIIINRGKKMKEVSLDVPNDEDTDILQNFADLLFSDESASPETEYMRSLVWEELNQALQELPDEQKEVFILMELDGLSAKEVAEATNVPVNTVLSRKHYAIKYLRFCMKDLYCDLFNS